MLQRIQKQFRSNFLKPSKILALLLIGLLSVSTIGIFSQSFVKSKIQANDIYGLMGSTNIAVAVSSSSKSQEFLVSSPTLNSSSLAESKISSSALSAPQSTKESSSLELVQSETVKEKKSSQSSVSEAVVVATNREKYEPDAPTFKVNSSEETIPVNYDEPIINYTAPSKGQRECYPSYPDLCLTLEDDLSCSLIPYKDFKVIQPDPFKFDYDKDGIGCESK